MFARFYREVYIAQNEFFGAWIFEAHMAEFYRVLAGFHRFRSLYHRGREAQEFNIAVSVGALLTDGLYSADYSVKAPVERTCGADAH